MHVFITDDALADLKDIWNFVAQSSVEAAERLGNQLIDRALAIGESPLAAPLLPGRERAGVRRVNVRSWAILYEIVDGQVEILNFVQGRGNPAKLR